MRTFNISVGVQNVAGGEVVNIDALVDTGATLTMLPQDLIDRLEVRQTDRLRIRLAEGTIKECGVGGIEVHYDGKRGIVSAGFLSAGARPLIGATTLETLGLAVDPVNLRLASVDLLG